MKKLLGVVIGCSLLLGACGGGSSSTEKEVPQGFKVISRFDKDWYDVIKLQDTVTTCVYIKDDMYGGLVPDLVQPDTCKEKMK